MKAIEVIEKKLEIKDIELPVLKDNEVLIKVKAAGLNRADIAQKNGLYPPPPGESVILGLVCSGIIESIGKNVNSKKPGDEVIVPTFSIISCISEILRRGIKPIFIDVDPTPEDVNLFFSILMS